MFGIKPNGIISNAQYPKALEKAITLKNKLLGFGTAPDVSSTVPDYIEQSLLGIGPTEYTNNTVVKYTGGNYNSVIEKLTLLTKISLLALEESTSDSPLYYCKALEEANFPKMKDCDAVARSCTKLTKIHLPELKSLYSSAFYGCSALKILHLPKCTQMDSGSLKNCAVEHVILSGDAYCSLRSTLDATVDNLYIYVPASLYNTYVNDSNWAPVVGIGHLLIIEDNLETVNNLLDEIGEPIIEPKEENLIPYPYYSEPGEYAGVTFTDDGTGTITANGTGTGTGGYIFTQVPLPKGDYVLSGCPAGGSFETYILGAAVGVIGAGEGSYYTNCYDFGEGATISVTEDNSYAMVAFMVMKDYTVENLTFKPVIKPVAAV